MFVTKRSMTIFLLCLPLSLAAQEATVTTTTIQRTVTSTPPTGECTTVPAHWENDVWVTEHTACQYANRTEGTTWVADYWSCKMVENDGTCSSWIMVPGHWETR